MTCHVKNQLTVDEGQECSYQSGWLSSLGVSASKRRSKFAHTFNIMISVVQKCWAWGPEFVSSRSIWQIVCSIPLILPYGFYLSIWYW